jgi:hypothetical protein
VKRLVTGDWVASAHSIVLRSDGKVPLLSTSNLFRSDDATQQIWKFWGSVPRGVTVRFYHALGAPNGAKLEWITNDNHAMRRCQRPPAGASFQRFYVGTAIRQ